MILWQQMYVFLVFSLNAANKIVEEQGLNHPGYLHVLMDKNVDHKCNVMKKTGGKMPTEQLMEVNRY